MTLAATQSRHDNCNGGIRIMPASKRSATMQAERIRRVKVGDHDVISRAAYQARVPICGKGYPADGDQSCTRAAGHNEGTHRTSGSDHVATGIGYIALAVWL